MEIYSNYSEIPLSASSVILTIGNFDAVHLGHISVLQRAYQVAQELEGVLFVLTFSTHPSAVLRPEVPLLRLCTETQKLKLLQEQRVDGVILLDFTLAFSQQTAEEFLTSMSRILPFKALVLGHDARLGKDRLGDSLKMMQIADELSFQLDYLPAYASDKSIVSSSAIRRAIISGNFLLAEKMLGRKFSIFTMATTWVEGREFALDVKGLCLPPPATYPVKVYHEGRTLAAEAVVEEAAVTLALHRPYLSLAEKVIEVLF